MEKLNFSKSAKSFFSNDYESFEVSSYRKKNDEATSRYSNGLQFWLSCLGYAVGYGNIWRFPYMLYKNGGGVFLIPYLVCIIVIVLPLEYLEISYGQVYRRAIHRYYDIIHPRLLGVSFGISAILFFIATYYMCLISWCFSFLLMSFQDPLPWAPKEGQSDLDALTGEGYFINEFLNRSTGLFDISSYNPIILISFAAVSALIFLTVFKGIHTAKYVVYFVVPLPYFLLTILFIKGLTLEGNTIGWAFLFKPEWEKLFTLGIWSDAAGQVLFSAGLAHNTVIKFASHRHEEDPLFWSTVMIPILNFATSIFASLALFSFVGYASFTSGIPISEMPIKGMELTFVVYPALLNTLPFPQFWSVLFFIMLVCLGFGTQYIFIDCISALIHGTLSRRKSYKKDKLTITIWVCVVIFLINIIFFASNAGYYWVETVDHYATSINLVVFCLIQLVVFVYFLPISDLADKIREFGEEFPKIYLVLLKVICPIFSLFLAATAIYNEICDRELPKALEDKIFSYAIFLTPLGLFLFFFIWNPFGKKEYI